MSVTQLKPDEVEAALITAIANGELPGGAVVRALSSSDVSQQGEFTRVELRDLPAAVFLVADEGSEELMRDVTHTNYQATQNWMALVGAKNLSSDDAERSDVLKLLGAVRSALAGVRLDLADGGKTDGIILAGWARHQFDESGTWYVQRFQVSDSAQFAVKS